MATMIDSLTGISLNSPFFTNNPQMEFFPVHPKATKKNRAALLYGPNGSGKSTIAQGFREYVDSIQPRTIEVLPMAGTSQWVLTPGARAEKIFVFDEKYIEHSVKIQASGLDAIVLFGEQVQLEQQIQSIENTIEQQSALMHRLEEDSKKYSVASDVNSPQYWISVITRILQAAEGWAETAGIRIKHNRTSARVNMAEIDRLGALQPQKNQTETKAEYEKIFSVFNSIGTASQPIMSPIRSICFDSNIGKKAAALLATSVQHPVLSQREIALLELFGVKTIVNAKEFLINPDNSTCPVCLQPISSEYRAEIIQRIERILNKDVEDFRGDLRGLFLNAIQENSYQVYSALDSKIYEQLVKQIRLLNAAILEHNNLIQAKIDDPFEKMNYADSIDICSEYEAVNAVLTQLEESRVSYNGVIASRKGTEKVLLRLNDDLAHFAIKDAYVSLCKQRDAQIYATEKINTLALQIKELDSQRSELDARRKNFQIAADKINESLEYIFYAKGRLEIDLGTDQLYHLKSYGQPVKPEKISCGERNALALCYFFTEIAKDTDARNLYACESLLVIDDPISSFDLENRVGILSFLRFKLNQVLASCSTTKILVMTHDISVLFDLEKALEEIAKKCASRGRSAEFSLLQLKNKRVEKFEYNRHNEYTALLRHIYEYAKASTPDQDYVIGNVIRRVLEAFSTFSFKKGIEDVSLDEDILAMLPNERSRMYFQNSMYRLVLNSESHFKEAIQGAPESSFFSHLSSVEKQRTARDILCFIYKINERHILSHLPDAKSDLDVWWANISTTSSSA